MGLFLSQPGIVILTLLVACGRPGGKQKAPDPSPPAVDAPEQLVVLVDPDGGVTMHSSGKEVAAVEALAGDDLAEEGSRDSYSWGQGGLDCYRQFYESCRPVVQHGPHRVVYGYGGSTYEPSSRRRTYTYDRQRLDYRQGGQVIPYTYPRRSPSPAYDTAPSPAYSSAPRSPWVESVNEQVWYESALTHRRPETGDAPDQAMVALGRRFFFEKGFSRDGNVSCAHCHQPDRAFTDGRTTAAGLAVGRRNTPTILNARFAGSLFWDGRAPDLVAQAKGPVENPGEHGGSRGQVARVIGSAEYRSDYVAVFGDYPPGLDTALAGPAGRGALPPVYPDRLVRPDAEYLFDLIGDAGLRDRVEEQAAQKGEAPWSWLSRQAVWSDPPNAGWVNNWQNLAPARQREVNEVFHNFARAITAWEETVVTGDTPFDRFLDRLESTGSAAGALDAGKGFGQAQWLGYKLFRRAACDTCHSGPWFSDQQFHNIGLPAAGGGPDIGRVAVTMTSDTIRMPGMTDAGAFRTPGLRQVADTGPWMHNGSQTSLAAIIRHYRSFSREGAAFRNLSPQLRPAVLTDREAVLLETFLRSLTDSTLPVF